MEGYLLVYEGGDYLGFTLDQDVALKWFNHYQNEGHKEVLEWAARQQAKLPDKKIAEPRQPFIAKTFNEALNAEDRGFDGTRLDVNILVINMLEPLNIPQVPAICQVETCIHNCHGCGMTEKLTINAYDGKDLAGQVVAVCDDYAEIL